MFLLINNLFFREIDRASIAELQLELSKYQSLLVKKSTEMEEENQNWSINLNKEKQNRINAENEMPHGLENIEFKHMTLVYLIW